MWTFSRTQPYCDLSDEQVLDNCSDCYHSNRLSVTLPQPSGCQRELYDFMRHCWSVTPNTRPSFHEIYMFLAHKNVGFDPTLEKPVAITAMDDDAVNDDCADDEHDCDADDDTDGSCCSSTDSDDNNAGDDDARAAGRNAASALQATSQTDDSDARTQRGRDPGFVV